MPNTIFQNMTTPSPALRDIFRLTQGGQYHNPYLAVNNTDMNDDAFYGTLGGGDWYERGQVQETGNEGGTMLNTWSVRPDGWLSKLGEKYKGWNPQLEQFRDNEGNTSWRMTGGDYNLLPKTKFGTVDKAMPVNRDRLNKEVADPRLVYYDENYGWITPTWNRKRDWKDMVPQLAMSGVMMGMGGLMAPGMLAAGMPAGLAGSVPGTFHALARGASGALDGKGMGALLPALISIAAGSAGGLGGNAAQFARYAKPLMAIAQMARARQRRG